MTTKTTQGIIFSGLTILGEHFRHHPDTFPRIILFLFKDITEYRHPSDIQDLGKVIVILRQAFTNQFKDDGPALKRKTRRGGAFHG